MPVMPGVQSGQFGRDIRSSWLVSEAHRSPGEDPMEMRSRQRGEMNGVSFRDAICYFVGCWLFIGGHVNQQEVRA